ncbi:hypothetical protein EalM132_00157 [Exiguobacterium phage vB_EalM-132]|nr:hypothetical protein EalM132_00157 [Exiguobacterium phage vB_EalM-132]
MITRFNLTHPLPSEDGEVFKPVSKIPDLTPRATATISIKSYHLYLAVTKQSWRNKRKPRRRAVVRAIYQGIK